MLLFGELRTRYQVSFWPARNMGRDAGRSCRPNVPEQSTNGRECCCDTSASCLMVTTVRRCINAPPNRFLLHILGQRL